MGNEEDGHPVSDLEETPIHDYVKKNIAPDFTVPDPISKQRPYWDEFVQYKMSEEGVSRVIKNQRNTQQKTYHHNLGSGGYPTAIKKWNKMEADLLAKGITQESLEWGELQRIGFSLMGEHWTRRQGSAFMAQDCKKQ